MPWLVSSQLSYLMIWLLTDNSAQRRELLLQQSKRAVALAPASTAAAWPRSTPNPSFSTPRSGDYGRFGTRRAGFGGGRAAKLARSPLARFGSAGLVPWRREASPLTGAPTNSRAKTPVWRRRLDQRARAGGTCSLKRQTSTPRLWPRGQSGRVLCWDAVLKLRWWGDVAAARDALKTWPGWLAQEDRGLFQAWQAWMWSRQPEQALSLTRVAARDMVRDFAFYGPVAALRAQGANELARQWRNGGGGLASHAGTGRTRTGHRARQ